MSWHDDFDYWESIVRIWVEPATIINVEHDMQYSDGLARELAECPYPCCTHAYQMHTPREYWAHSHDGLCGMDGHWVTEGTEWAAYSAIGFCKIAPEARGQLPERCRWQHVEHAVNTAVRQHAGLIRAAWHVHWPGVEHYHYADRP